MQNIKSPLNYTGGKFKLLPQIQPLFPTKINTFYDLFFGGGNVGINCKAKKVVANDINSKIISLFEFLRNKDIQYILEEINKIINYYKLSDSISNGYDFYDCNSSSGLGAYNVEQYNNLKKDYNSIEFSKFNKELMLYLLIIYGFNNQIRFNKSGGYNIPVGKRDFNSLSKINLISFLERIKKINIIFSSLDFNQINFSTLNKDDFFYIDPPYLITTATYNESNAWNINKENELLLFLDNINKIDIKFALSNVIEHKNKKNDILINWCNNKKFQIHYLNFSYNNSSYQSKNTEAKTQEVLITNY